MSWTSPKTWAVGEILTAANMNTQVRDNLNALATVSINAQTASYTAALTDANEEVEINSASATTFTVPPNSSVGFTVGTTITIVQTGTGQVTVAAGAGVTVNGNPGLKLTGQWAAATLLKRATDTWVLVGNISS